VLYCTVLCCAVLCCAVLYCAVLCCAVLYCTVLYCAVLCCTVLYRAVLCCAVLCCAVPCCTVLCCAVLYCAVLYYTVLCCTVLCCTVLCCAVLYRAVLYYTVLCCTVSTYFTIVLHKVAIDDRTFRWLHKVVVCYIFFFELSLAATDKTVLPFSTFVIYFREQEKSNKKFWHFKLFSFNQKFILKCRNIIIEKHRVWKHKHSCLKDTISKNC